LEQDLKVVDAALKSAREDVGEREALDPAALEYLEIAKRHAEMSNLRGALSDKEKWIIERDAKANDLAAVESKLDLKVDSALREAETTAEKAGTNRTAAQTVLDGLRSTWNTKRSEAATTLKHLQDRLAEAEAEMEIVREAEAKGICPTCEQPLPDGHSPRSKSLGVLLENVAKQIASTATEVKSLESEPAEIAAARKALETLEVASAQAHQGLQSMKETAAVQRGHIERIASLRAAVGSLQKQIDAAPTTFDQIAFDNLASKMQALEPKRSRWQELAGAAERLKSTERQHHDKSCQFEVERKRQARDRKRKEELGFTREIADTIINELRQAQGSLPHVEKGVSDCKAAAASAQSALADAEQRLARWQANAEKIEVHRHERDLYREIGDAMYELRTKLNQEIRPTLAAFAADALSQITANRYTRIAIDDAFKATLIDGDYTKNVISGGEEDILALSLRIALSRYIQEKSGLPLTLLVLDEVFGSLDAERRDNVLELLVGLRGMFPQIILISHVDGLSEHADRVLRISYDPVARLSKVEEIAQESPALL
jgi:exonuclease SbcC